MKHVAAVKERNRQGAISVLLVGKIATGRRWRGFAAGNAKANNLSPNFIGTASSQILAVDRYRPLPPPKMSPQQPTEATTTTDGVHGQVQDSPQTRVILVGIGYVNQDRIRTHAYTHISTSAATNTCI